MSQGVSALDEQQMQRLGALVIDRRPDGMALEVEQLRGDDHMAPAAMFTWSAGGLRYRHLVTPSFLTAYAGLDWIATWLTERATNELAVATSGD